MTKIFITLVLTIICLATNAQTFNLTVNNGYGSGNYQTGDTVHIWSVAYDNTKTFGQWTGDSSFVERPREWHTTLIMPSQNLTVTAVLDNMPTYNITYEQIMGVNNLKKVYHFIPTNPKGVIFFFHGTGGSASGWIDKVENRSLINASIADNFGIIVTEAEEITLNTDLNGDGKLRWKTFPLDTMNGIDYLNIKAITDTFILRGVIKTSTPKFSIGMSNGGSFSAAISAAYNYKAGVSYCASSSAGVFQQRQSPFAFRMSKFDDNAEVGQLGNYQAWQNDSILSSRSICHDYLLSDRQPIYPQRFARVTGISLVKSQSIFNELSSNNQLDSNQYAIYSTTLATNIQSNPSAYPTIISLTINQQQDAFNQIAASNAEHNFYSDYNYETLNFFNELCGTTVGVENPKWPNDKIKLYPNPFNSKINILGATGLEISTLTNLFGQMIWSGINIEQQDFSNLMSGIYFLTIVKDNDRQTFKLIKK